MNILDITNEDVERLKENKIVFGLLPERDREILRCVDTGNVERYCHSGFYRCKKGGSFDPCAVYRIIADYQPPAPTEADIIAYLQASEVPPVQWHPAAQEWAKGKKDIWEFYDGKTWHKCGWIGCLDDEFSIFPHRLRADYGFTERYKDVVYDHQGLIDIVNKTKPETCEWKFKPCYPCKCWQGPHNTMNHFSDECFKFCPDCGKRIEIKP